MNYKRLFYIFITTSLILLVLLVVQYLALSHPIASPVSGKPIEQHHPWNTFIDQVDKNSFSIVLSIVLLIPAAFVSYFVSIWIDNRKHSKLSIFMHDNTKWYSSFYIADRNCWYDEEIIIKRESGKIVLETSTPGSEYNWKGYCLVRDNRCLYGSWVSKKAKQSNGTMSMVISLQGDYLHGHYAGSNGSREYTTGPWVIAISPEKLKEAKQQSYDPTTLFHSDMPINSLNKKWHFYHVTQVDGKDLWRCSILDFTGNSSNNVLTTLMREQHPETKEEIIYKIDGGVRGSHLVLFAKQEAGTESYSIALFPFMNDNLPGSNSGYIVGQNWDGDKFVGKAILSKLPVSGISTAGTVTGAAKERLEEQWRRGILKNIVSKDIPGKQLNSKRVGK